MCIYYTYLSYAPSTGTRQPTSWLMTMSTSWHVNHAGTQPVFTHADSHHRVRWRHFLMVKRVHTCGPLLERKIGARGQASRFRHRAAAQLDSPEALGPWTARRAGTSPGQADHTPSAAHRGTRPWKEARVMHNACSAVCTLRLQQSRQLHLPRTRSSPGRTCPGSVGCRRCRSQPALDQAPAGCAAVPAVMPGAA